MKIDWFYSDPHFGHKNIIKYCRRPFYHSHHMDYQLVKRFNSRVSPDDTTLWVGDCFFGSVEYASRILSNMNGRHILVRGNHDRSKKQMREIGFEEVHKTLTIENFFDDGEGLYACHYPNVPHLIPRPFVYLHGHTHSSKSVTEPYMYHVGIDSWGYAPVHRNEIQCLLNQEAILKQDK